MAAVSSELHAVTQTLATDVATGEVVQALGARGIPSIVLRGPAVARLLYDDQSRTFGARACPRLLDLMYPSRTRVVLSVLKTSNEAHIGPGPAISHRVRLARTAANARGHPATPTTPQRTLVCS